MANVTKCRDFVGRAGGRPDVVVQQLAPRSEAAVLDLLYHCGQSSCSNQCLPAMSQMTFDRISLTPPLASWTAGCFLANELRGVVCAGYASCQGHVAAMILVDERWRRQGIGSVLLEETMDWARRGEANRLRFVCERTDWPMRHFAIKFGARLDLVLGQIVIDIPLAF